MAKVEEMEYKGIIFRRYPESKRFADRNYYKPNGYHIKRCIGSHTKRFGGINLEKYQKVFTSTIKTAIILITGLKILNVCQEESTYLNTQICTRQAKNTWTKSGRLRVNGIDQKREKRGTNHTVRTRGRIEQPENSPATIVEKLISLLI